MSDYKKLQAFVEAAITNPKHPVYQLGMVHSPILQHYRVNVEMLGSVKPEQWFQDYPAWSAKLEEVQRLCEEDEAELARESAKTGADSAKVKALETQVASLTATVNRLLETGNKPAADESGKTAKPAAEGAKPDKSGQTPTAGADEDEPFDGMEDE